MEKTIYIRMRNRTQVNPEASVVLKDIAQVIAEEQILEKLQKLPVHRVTLKDNNIIVIDIMRVIRLITSEFPDAEVQAIGPPQTIIEVIFKRKVMSFALFVLTWILLFIGAALTIMNFHEDVSMQGVQKKLFAIVTGKRTDKPLLFQVPYSLGIGLGMVLFFNHVFKKRLNEEPSPLEVEMFNYQQALDQYVAMYENKESVKHLDDR
ncbi:stage V sporulation protein AA [Mesobacillus zeae]|uniref:Stage V sporulation protein AA n=1 Tax=Mesobacillus zeae TaxID=1917180 RepID=A0A398BI44_9BACI|nr:stage V sporulation protein AA [Mesobacillus zeae]RID87380.1 stage V sporulation protein AA [Mesobacillus zeae]